MNADFEKFVQFVLKWEGRTFENDPDDPGGATKYGICLRSLIGRAKYDATWLASIGVALPASVSSIRNLSEAQAVQIYERYYWSYWSNEMNMSGIDARRTQAAVCDADINCGTRQATKLLQRALGVTGDGIIGLFTLRAWMAADDADLAKRVNMERRYFYESLATQKPKFKKFLRGWLNRVNDLDKFLESF